MMQSKLSQLQKFAAQLAGIYSVLEVMIASFTEAVSAHVNDLHQLIENTLKAKQVLFLHPSTVMDFRPLLTTKQ